MKIKSEKGATILFIILGVIALIAILLISNYNGLVSKKEAVSKASSDLATTLERRADLIPNLVNTVKGFTSHENEVIDKITKARQNLLNANSLDDKLEANDELSKSLSSLMVVVENYPDLKSSENFLNLQTELAGTENRIAQARRDYNEKVNEYNSSIKTFPSNIFAGMFGFSEEKYFEASASAQEVPSVNFE